MTRARSISWAVVGCLASWAAPGCVDTTPRASPVAANADPRSGITLPREWPPRDTEFINRVASDPPQAPRAPDTPPYCSLPGVRRVDGGRQLFVDDYLVDWARTRNVTRTWGRLRLKNPAVLTPNQGMDASCHQARCKGMRTARPFGGGSLYDPARRRLLLWYRCGWRGGPHHGVPGGRTCVATSRDGLRFERPKLATSFSPAPDRRALRPRSPKVVRPARGTNVVLATAHVEAFEPDRRALRPHSPKVVRPARGTNVVLATAHVEAFEVAYDFLRTPPRFVALRMEYMTGGRRYREYTPYVSADGLAWTKPPPDGWRSPGVLADRSTFFLNPLRRDPVWAFSLRENLCRGGPSRHMRARRLFEAPHAEAPLRRIAMRGGRPLYGAYFQCEPLLEGDAAVPCCVSTSELGYPEKYCVDLREPPRHRADVATGDNVASMA